MQRKHRSLGDEETDDLARFPEPVKGWPQDMTPKAQVPEAKINKWKYSKLECFRTAEKNNKMKRQPRKREGTFACHISDEGCISKLHKELIELNSEKPQKTQIIQF